MNAAFARVSAVLIGVALGFEAQSGDDGLGRLFWTPAERASFDRARENTAPPVGAAAGYEPLQKEARVVVKGIVVRNDGQHAVWINDTSTVRDGADLGAFGVTSQAVDSRRITVRVGEQGHAVKPGQVLFLDSGQVEEGYKVPALPAAKPAAAAEMPGEAVDAAAPPEVPAVVSGDPATALPSASVLNAPSRESAP